MKLSFSLLLAALLFPTILHAQAPVAAFTANNTTGCAPFPLVVNFTDQSTNSPTSWLWTFGDPNGSSSTLQNPAFVYSDPGCYTVTLTATNASGNNTVVQTCFVEIYPQPDPGFNVDLAEGCAPLTVTFSDASVPNAASLTNWNWTLASNNIPLSGSSPTYTFTTPDTTGVILTVTNSNGCQNTIVVPDVVAILEPPLADFSVDVNSACTPPLTVNFSNLSTTNGASNPTYTWLFPGGQTPGGLSSFTGSVPPPVTYNANGQYDVTLILESTNECADTITYTSLIGIGGVNADFTVSDTLICVGDPLVFTNTSTGGATSIEWEVDGQPGVDGTANTLNYVYNTAGVYTITLRANNTQCGDTLTRVNHVTVFDRPTSSFSVDKLVDCQPGLPFTFTDLSMGAANWSWDFGDGNTSNLPNPVHTYANFGSYNACLTVTNADGCTDVFCETINIAPANAAISFNPDEGCAPTTVNFSDNSQTSGDPVISWDWDFFSANATPSTATVQNPSVTYSAAGLYDVQLIITTQGGCTDTVFVNNAIEIGDPPQLDFTVDKDTVCINEDITFSSTFTDPNWQYFWDFQYQDPGNFSLNNDTAMTVYADTGFFDVGLIILSQGCRDTLIIDSMVYVSPPDARFFPSDIAVCFPPQTISFADSSIGPIDVYEWYVNGVFYSDQPTPPDLALNAVGSYLVTQIVTDTLTGCTDTADVVVSAGGPVADFDVTDTVGCRPFPVPVNNNSQNATIFQTYFGFGASPLVGISNSPNPARTFPDTGSYSIQMIARDNLGCADTLTRTNYISVLGTYPDFSNTPVLGCRPLPVDFTDLSQSSSLSNIVSWDWDFGDGIGSSTLQNPTYVYPNTGTYDVSLATTDDAGCVDTVVIPDAVKVTFPAPDFIVDDDSSCAGADLVFTSISNGFNPMTFSWNFGDGNTGTGSPVTHAYADTGFYDVTLIVTDGNGCVDSITYNDLVYIEPFEANFSGDPNIGVCPPLTTAFTDSTIGNVVGWDWDFGTGINTSNLQNPQNVYFLPGNFTVSLIATHEDGCQDTVTKVDYVQLNGPNGSFSLNPPNACLGDTVCIEAVLLGTDIGIVDWKNGSTSVLQGLSGVVDTVSVCQVYNNPGKYFPQIVVTDNNGCSVTLNSPDSTQVYVLPQAQIMPVDSAGCLPFNLPFVDASLAGDTLIDTWTWLFGDGDTSFVQNPDHTYQAESIFTVTLAIEDANGCVDTTTTTVTTYEGTIGEFSALDTVGCAPFTVDFTDASTNLPPTNWTWIFGDGDTLTGVASPSHTYQNDGVYTVTLIVDDNLGCSDTVVKTDYVVLNHPVATVYADTVFGCNPVNLTFFADSSVIDSNRTVVEYEWCLEDVNTGQITCQTTTVDSLVVPFNVGGDYAMVLTVTDNEGCSGTTAPLPVTINTRIIPDPLDIRNVTVLSDNSAELLWAPYPGSDFVEYAVYRTGPGAPVLVGTITDQNTVTYLDTDPSLDFTSQSYCYKVLVQNVCLEYSILDDTEEHCTIDLDVSPGTDALILNWNDYVGYPVASYEIYRANDYNPANVQQIGAVPGNVLTFTDLETFCEDSISYRVRAVGADPNARSFSDLSGNAPFHPDPVESSHILTATVVDDTVIDVSWTDYGGYRPLGYFVEKSVDGIVWDSIGSFPLTTTILTDPDVLVDDMSYYYRVFAVDECGDVSVEGRYGKSILLQARLDQTGKVPVLSWSGYEEWLLGVRNYQVEVFNEQSGQWDLVNQVSGSTRRFEDTETQLFQATYCYRIRAFETGNFAAEAVSNEVCVTFGPAVYTPNAFSPNNDGRNDEFRVFVPNLRVGELVIFNRWGEELYRSNDLEQGWDGTKNGVPVSEGVYVFVVSGIGQDNSPFNRSGTVTLFR